MILKMLIHFRTFLCRTPLGKKLNNQSQLRYGRQCASEHTHSVTSLQGATVSSNSVIGYSVYYT